MIDLAVQTTPQTKTNRLILIVSRLLMIVALLILFGYLLIYAAFAVNLMQFPFDYDQGEGFELVDTIMFSEGRLPYQDTNVYPFYSSNYPPLFHVMAAPFVWLFGEAYWYGRLLGFLGTLVAAAAIGVAVYREGDHKAIAVLSALAFLASNTIYHIGPLFRQHMTMVMFETLAVVVLANVNEIEDTRKRRMMLAVGLGLVLAAGYTKQLALATAIAVFVFLVIRQPRRAVVWGIVFAAVGGGIFLWLNRATNGQWWLQTISANVNNYIPDQTFGLYRLWFSLHGFLIVPAVLYTLYELYFARLSLYTIWFAAAVANAALSGKWGAGDSYFATSIAALCILSGICFSRLVRGNWSFAPSVYTRWLIDPFRQTAPIVVAVSLVVVPLCYVGYGRAVLHMPTQGAVFEPIADLLGLHPNADNGFYDSAGRIAGGYADIGHFTTPEDTAAGWRIVDLVRQAEGDVLSEEAAFTLLAGKTVITNPTQILNLSLNGQFDSTALVGMIERRDFDLVILRALFYPQDVIDAIYASYEQTETIHMNGFDYMILTPIQAE